jgi:hypothetical protein
LELLRAIRQTGRAQQLRFWRDPDGPEVDWIVEHEQTLMPIEVKWSDAPSDRDARHLRTFLAEYSRAQTGVIVCRTPRRFKIGSRITAVPWQEIPDLVADVS